MYTIGNIILSPTPLTYFVSGILALSIVFSIVLNKRFRTHLRPVGWSSKSIVIWKILSGIIAVLLVASYAILLSNPIWKSSRETVTVNGNSVVFALDLSKSMLAEDMKPNRIWVAKKLLSDFVKNGDFSKVWLVIFSGEAFTSVPLTQDRDAFLQAIESVTPDTIRQELPGLSGTSIGNALLLSADQFNRETTNWDEHKAIILLTDGEANTGVDPTPVAKSMEGKGIPVYTIGIGSEAGTDLYITDTTGAKRYFLGEDGKPIRAILDESLLRFIASETGWEYHSGTDENTLSWIFTSLSKLSKWERKTIVVPLEKPLQSEAAWACLILSLTILFLRRKFGESSFF